MKSVSRNARLWANGLKMWVLRGTSGFSSCCIDSREERFLIELLGSVGREAVSVGWSQHRKCSIPLARQRRRWDITQTLYVFVRLSKTFLTSLEESSRETGSGLFQLTLHLSPTSPYVRRGRLQQSVVFPHVMRTVWVGTYFQHGNSHACEV